MSEHKEPAPDEVIQKWFDYLDHEQEKTVKLQKAASLARAGKHEEARRIQHAVDMSPRVFDGAYLLPAVKAVLKDRDEAFALLREAGAVLRLFSLHVNEYLNDEIRADNPRAAIKRSNALLAKLEEAR